MTIYSFIFFFLPRRMMESRYQECQFHKGTSEEILGVKGTLVPQKDQQIVSSQAVSCSWGRDSKNSPIVLWFLELTQLENSRSEGLTNHLLKSLSSKSTELFFFPQSPQNFYPLVKCILILITFTSLTSICHFLLILVLCGYEDKSIYPLPVQESELRVPCK